MYPFRLLGQYLWNVIYPQPPSGAGYGYRWRPGQPIPASFSVFDPETAPPGLFVVFQSAHLSPRPDPFDAGVGGVGTVYPPAAAPSQALTALVNTVTSNPPAGAEGTYWQGVSPQRLLYISGFLSYVDTCLRIINQMPAGQNLLHRLDTGPYAVFISPAAGTNQTFASTPDNAVTYLTRKIANYPNETVRDPNIRTMVDQTYPNINGVAARYDQLAADVNALPLYSLFVQQGQFANQFLANFFQFRNARVTGQDLMDWFSAVGFPAFDQNVTDFPGVQQGVTVREFFLLSLIFLLNAQSPTGTGCGAGVKFNVRNEGDNVLGSPQFRPPAIGLAHELMHALHYGQGTAPGYEIGGFTTTAAELKFTGIQPYNNEPVSENAVRQNWIAAAPGGLDPSNVWAAPALRNAYEPPVPPNTATTLRTRSLCI